MAHTKERREIMDLARRLTATAVAFLAVATTGVATGASPAAAAPKEETPEQVQKRTGHHSRAVCEEKKPDHASCLARVIDRGESSPTPLMSNAPYGASPAEIKAAYGFPTDPNAGAGKTIAIISAYDNPSIHSELNTFSSTYGLPCNSCLTKVNQTGGTTYPAPNTAWALETSLDVQWAHAIAPGAKILLVEATTNSWSNLMAAVDYAKTRAQYVSMSFGGPEFASQVNYDSRFSAPGVSFFAAAGDSGLRTTYPSSSPYVVSVGGTTLKGAGTSNVTETAWSLGGGGCSAYEYATRAQRSFPQYSQSGCKGGRRATPDVALNADPEFGMSVYHAAPPATPGWYRVGGTSASAPMWAARAAVEGGLMDSARIYGPAAPPLRDITSGSNGAPALVGYDLATGRGSWFSGTAAPPPSTTPTTTPTTPPASNGLANGGFDTGTLTSWAPGGAVSVVAGGAQAGTHAVQVGSANPTNGDSRLYQSFTAPAGATQVSFWYKPTCPETVATGWATATLRDAATMTTATILPRTCATAGWTQVTAPIVAGRGYTLYLTSHDDNVVGTATSTLFDTATTS